MVTPKKPPKPVVEIDRDRVNELMALRKDNYIPEELRDIIRFTTLQMILAGFTNREITRKLKDEFEIADHTARKTLNNARKEIRNSVETAVDDVKFNTSVAVFRLQNLFKISLENENVKEALQVLKQLHALQGLAVSEGGKVQVNIANQVNSQANLAEYSDDELRVQFIKQNPKLIENTIPARMTVKESEEIIDNWDD